MKAAEAGAVELGGCSMSDDAPHWRCRVCHHAEPGPFVDWDAFAGPDSGEFASFRETLSEGTVPSSDAGVEAISKFALSFDGYAAFGKHLTRIAKRARRCFAEGNTVPPNLAVLRGCLFFEQRAAHWTGHGLETGYVRALVQAILGQCGRGA